MLSYPKIIAGLLLLLSLAAQGHTLSSQREFTPVDDPDLTSPEMSLQRNIFVLDSLAPRSAFLAQRPWANSDWRTESGLIAARYADSEFRSMNSWSERLEYVKDHPAQEVLADTDTHSKARRMDRLSPAEKYDIVVGDTEGTLTRSEWQAGENYDRLNTMESWMGICEGTAAASVAYPEPKHSVTLLAPDGSPVVFHILDIKALASLAWSAYTVKVPIAGSRCKTDDPSTDSHDVVTDPRCFDPNPGTLHIAVLTFLGLQNRPVLIDRVTAVEVWNVPVVSYKVHYYNSESGDESRSIQAGLTPLKALSHDIYRNYRSPQATDVIDVEMKIQVATGGTGQRDQQAQSSKSEMIFRYDLELDSTGNIVGGEWHQDEHPDFIWQIQVNQKPTSEGDTDLIDGTLAMTDKVPSAWLKGILRSSALNQPLEHFVSRLVELSVQ
jgi:hypothetical protein